MNFIENCLMSHCAVYVGEGSHVIEHSMFCEVVGNSVFPLEKEVATFQNSCLGKPMDRGAWQAIVHGVTKESNMT